jgi:hypothetical protein
VWQEGWMHLLIQLRNATLHLCSFDRQIGNNTNPFLDKEIEAEKLGGFIKAKKASQ